MTASDEAARGDGREDGSAEKAEVQNSIDLVHRAQDGDQAAYEELFRRYFLVVRRLIRARMGERLRREASSEDLAQEAMLEAIRDFPTFKIESRAALIALFVAIAEHRLRANARRARAQKRDRDREVTLQRLRRSIADGSIDFAPADDEPLPEEEVAKAELRVRIREVLHELDEEYRRVIELRIYQELSWEEIAGRIGSPTANAARMTYGRAIVKLRSELDRIDGMDPEA